MDETYRALLIDAIEAAFADAGQDLYAGAARFKAWLDKRYPMLEASLSRERLDAFLASEPADQERVRQFVVLIGALPALVPDVVQQFIRKQAEAMPRALPGRRRIEPETKRKIIDAIGRLHMQGVAMGLAQARAAQQFGLGKRTVERVWRQRGTISTQPFQTMDDVWRFMAR